VEASERDTTQDWLLPEDAAPPLLGELEARIEDAVASAHAAEESAQAAEDSARAAEEEVRAIGAAAVAAAEQATRAAEMAERASITALDASTAALEGGPPEDASLRSFSERADRVVARLRALERVPRRPEPASAVATRRRGAD